MIIIMIMTNYKYNYTCKLYF